jgi:hypothetical protein
VGAVFGSVIGAMIGKSNAREQPEPETFAQRITPRAF